jgi:hypothetical protein
MDDDDPLLAKAKALDEMTKSVTASEADVLERVLVALNEGKRPKPKDIEKIETMYDKYIGSREDEEGGSASGTEGDLDDGETPPDDEVDW